MNHALKELLALLETLNMGKPILMARHGDVRAVTIENLDRRLRRFVRHAGNEAAEIAAAACRLHALAALAHATAQLARP